MAAARRLGSGRPAGGTAGRCRGRAGYRRSSSGHCLPADVSLPWVLRDQRNDRDDLAVVGPGRMAVFDEPVGGIL